MNVEPTIQFLVVKGIWSWKWGGVTGMVGRSQKASGDMCGYVQREIQKEMREG